MSLREDYDLPERTSVTSRMWVLLAILPVAALILWIVAPSSPVAVAVLAIALLALVFGGVAFASLVHRHDPWDGPTENNPPSEQFAEAYALCARHPRLHAQYFANYHYAPTPRVHGRVCSLIRRLGA